jgi:phage gp29-like protein
MIKHLNLQNFGDPRQLQKTAEKQVTNEMLKESMDIITSIEDCIKRIEEYFKSGFTQVCVHSTSPDEIVFIQSFCKKALPHFNRK